tara:strand:- start:1067 stop:1717 length:651 start_codon:yes stop_codon:yes gene_type:complete
MFDYKKARKNMVDNQIRPSNVTNRDLLESLSLVQRENFVSLEDSTLSYSDTYIRMEDGRNITSPRLIAKMIDGLKIKKKDIVLSIAPGFGYSCALMATLCELVVAVEKESIAEEAQNRLVEGGFDNVIVIPGDLAQGAVEHGPYDALIIEGGLETLPKNLTDQVKLGGRIVAIFVKGKLGHCNFGLKTRYGIDWKVLFEVSCPILSEFKINQEFVF